MILNIYRNKRILVTGHTGFKGSWLVLWLKILGAKVYGLSLPKNTDANHWGCLNLNLETYEIDIRNYKDLESKISSIKPDLIFHLAAQSLVIDSFEDPLKTFSTNIIGTANLLNICRPLNNLFGVITVTSDKCYENKGWLWGYRENDRLGGKDPYSASKASTEIVVSSFRDSFYDESNSALLSTARGGNVIGGGDWSKNRLIPDIIRSIKTDEILKIRNPDAIRPWQHVLDCLMGYLLLGEKILRKDRNYANSWNFGPGINSIKTVEDVIRQYKLYDKKLKWKFVNSNKHEAQILSLDSTKSNSKLGWKPILSFEDTIQWTFWWYQSFEESGKVESINQIENYMELI